MYLLLNMASRGKSVAKYQDVFKHSVLCRLLPSLNESNRPWTFVDFYAGPGAYRRVTPANKDTFKEEEKELEGRGDGLDQVLEYTHNYEKERGFKRGRINYINQHSRYVTFLRKFYKTTGQWKSSQSSHDNDHSCDFYPTSIGFAREFMRKGDRAILMEKGANNFKRLEHVIGKDRRMTLINGSPSEQADAALPPTTSNGLAYFDIGPEASYDELVEMADLVKDTCAKWPLAMKMITYPIGKSHHHPDIDDDLIRQPRHPVHLLRRIIATGQTKILNAELYLKDLELQGVGVCIINPPLYFEDELSALSEALHDDMIDPAYHRDPYVKQVLRECGVQEHQLREVPVVDIDIEETVEKRHKQYAKVARKAIRLHTLDPLDDSIDWLTSSGALAGFEQDDIVPDNEPLIQGIANRLRAAYLIQALSPYDPTNDEAGEFAAIFQEMHKAPSKKQPRVSFLTHQSWLDDLQEDKESRIDIGYPGGGEHDIADIEVPPAGVIEQRLLEHRRLRREEKEYFLHPHVTASDDPFLREQDFQAELAHLNDNPTQDVIDLWRSQYDSLVIKDENLTDAQRMGLFEEQSEIMDAEDRKYRRTLIRGEHNYKKGR